MKRIAFILCLLLPLSAGATVENVREYHLDNGLTLIVRPDHRAPVVVSQIWYRVGSSYEHRGITGVSHMLEHMMFKGTDTWAPGEFSRIIAAEGGRDNAFTGRDFTGYYQQLAADRLPIAFALEADRMQNLRLQEAEFALEHEVVKEERRQRVENNPTALMMERFNAVAHTASTYRQPIIGWMDDIENYTLADLQAWYERWYSPENAIIVVVGDVDPNAVYALAERHFGAIPARPVRPHTAVGEVPAPGERRVRVELPAELPVLTMGYLVPSLNTAETAWEPYALQVMATILSGGSAARLPNHLVRGAEVAASASAHYSPVARLDTLFQLAASPVPGESLETLERALRGEVARLQDELVSDAELERARNQIMADHLFQLDSVFYQAMEIGLLETTGIGWRELEHYEERVRAVTPEQIREVARRYLVPERLTVGMLEPQAGGAQ